MSKSDGLSDDLTQSKDKHPHVCLGTSPKVLFNVENVLTIYLLRDENFFIFKPTRQRLEPCNEYASFIDSIRLNLPAPK